jgi:hypothetical protein
MSICLCRTTSKADLQLKTSTPGSLTSEEYDAKLSYASLFSSVFPRWSQLKNRGSKNGAKTVVRLCITLATEWTAS